VRKERWLCVLRGGELFSRSFEAKATDVGAKRGVNLTENTAGHRKRFGEVFSHSGLLRALTREKEDDVHR
jgi:hypothetical protein